MKIHKVEVTLTQSDVQEVANEWMPAGYVLEHVHLSSSGVLASLKTPFIRLNVQLRKEAELTPGVFVFSLGISKGVKVPKRIIQMVLHKLATNLPKGITVMENQVIIAVQELWAPFVSAKSVLLTLSDGQFTLVAEPLSIAIVSPAKDITTHGGIA